MSYKVGETSLGVLNYEYDGCGYIKRIDLGSGKNIYYTYDKFGRLVREDNKAMQSSYYYTYDNYGNVLSKEQISYTDPSKAYKHGTGTKTVFNYVNGKLTKANDGTAIAYDANGCPTLYRGFMASWSKGNQLSYFYNSYYTYDGLGRRISKTISGRNVKYTVEYFYDSQGRLMRSSDGMEYFYDDSGVIGFKYGGNYYTYQKDIQNNVIGIIDSNGTKVVEYTYDAWGNFAGSGFKKTVTQPTKLADINPFRYRSYFYDTDTGLYYLQTRYYDPAVCRFISPDSIDNATPNILHGLNLYAYCGNNPVMNVDPTGESFWGDVGRFLGGIVLGLMGAAISLRTVVPALFNSVAAVACEIGLMIGFYGAALIGSVFDSAIYSDMGLIGWNPFNTNADAVMLSQKMSFYKGVPVIRADMSDNRSGSFGIIMLDIADRNADTVRHEYGHIPQLMTLGIVKYGLCIGIPSWKEWYKKTPWDYYEAPWDAGADYFGGVQNSQLSDISKDRAMRYLLYSYLLGPIVHSFYKNL